MLVQNSQQTHGGSISMWPAGGVLVSWFWKGGCPLCNQHWTAAELSAPPRFNHFQNLLETHEHAFIYLLLIAERRCSADGHCRESGRWHGGLSHQHPEMVSSSKIVISCSFWMEFTGFAIKCVEVKSKGLFYAFTSFSGLKWIDLNVFWMTVYKSNSWQRG